jgi:uncharacterized protein (TIGR02217 family)
MAFDETRFPTTEDYGYRGGPRFKTTLFIAKSGHEQRVANWSATKGMWTVGFKLRGISALTDLRDFFYARYGRARAFRFRDWNDYCSDMAGLAAYNLANGTTYGGQGADIDTLPPEGELTAQSIGTGGNSPYQLIKDYTDLITFTKVIYKPVSGAVRLYDDGVEITSGVTPDYTTGLVTVSPDASGAVTADFYFDIPVRFDTDYMDSEIEFFELNNWDGIPIVETRDIA